MHGCLLRGPRTNTPGMTTNHKAHRVGVRDTVDLVALAPYLLGYQPDERLVFLVLESGRLHATGAVELAALAVPAEVEAALDAVIGRLSQPLVMLCAWSEDSELAWAALDLAQQSVGSHRVLDCVVVDADGWTSRTGRHGDRQSLQASPAVTEAVVAGYSVAPSREAAVAVVQGPEGSLRQELEDLYRATEEVLVGRGESSWLPRALGLARQARASQQPTRTQLAELGLLAGLEDVRERLWLEMSRRNAAADLELWTRVVAQTPPTFAVGPLLVMGFAAWLSGEGALLVSCVERAEALDYDGWELDVLSGLNRGAVPPSTWEQARAAEVFGVRGC